MFSSTTWGVREEMISLIETCKFDQKKSLTGHLLRTILRVRVTLWVRVKLEFAFKE